MNKMYKPIYLLRTFFTGTNTGTSFIRNKELPICSTCLYFIEHTNNYPYDPTPSNEQYGRCKKFGEVNVITGTIAYDLASNCRTDTNKCGKFGTEYNGHHVGRRAGGD